MARNNRIILLQQLFKQLYSSMKEQKNQRRSTSLMSTSHDNKFISCSANRTNRLIDSAEKRRSFNKSQDQKPRQRSSARGAWDKNQVDKPELSVVRQIQGLDPRLKFYYLGKGNNHQLIRRTLDRRKIWVQNNELPLVHFKWTQTTQMMKFHMMNKCTLCYNHFEYHRQISNKQYLIRNLTKFCESNKINAFDITPTTFVIDLYDDQYDLNLNSFVKFFNHNLPKGKKTIQKLSITLPKSFNQSFNKGQKRSQGNFYTRPTIHPTFFSADSHYVWLLKPTFLNRGRGIHIFTSLPEFERLVNQYVGGNFDNIIKKQQAVDKDMYQSQVSCVVLPQLSNSTIKQKEPTSTKQTKQVKQELLLTQDKKPPSCNIKATAFVVQKYIQRPLLIHGRKFDIRVWVLVTHNLELYFFKEGYIRTSCQEYTLGNLDNMYIHLTNNAIQKYSDKYEKFQFGNQLSFAQLDQILELQGESKFSERMIKKMKQSIWVSMCSVKRKLNFRERRQCFEIFGYDFFIDNRMKVWLIQVNTNPCLQESSPLLGQLIPRMVDDAFKLTLDKLYPHKQNVEGPSVNGYEDGQSMWELLGDLSDANRNSLNKRYTFVRR